VLDNDILRDTSGGDARGTAAPAPLSVGARGIRGYEAYCRRQTQRLLALLPREAIRPLYREARRQLVETAAGAGDDKDPMAVLHAYCRKLLPLPPMDVWEADVASNPSAYLDDAATDEPLPESLAAARTVEARFFMADGRRWSATLGVHRDGGIWRGHIAFRTRDGTRTYRTAEIFREGGAEALRDRFQEFDDVTLHAFLRSARP
jgi:hypothetical protein